LHDVGPRRPGDDQGHQEERAGRQGGLGLIGHVRSQPRATTPRGEPEIAE
jgi:hypothetical protein